MAERIAAQQGDIASFHFSGHGKICGKILHVPQDTGDCWIIMESSEGQKSIVYIQQFDYMFLRKS